ncbi:MAG: hypothetical protein J5972_00690 [Eubacterium sp.]|nr:hypothetical protein [Eubacterium sp.]
MDGITLYSIQYYKKTIFKGSYRGMNFRIQKAGEDDEPVLLATAWKGPYILEKTEEDPVSRRFEFSDEGLKEADQWLEEQQPLITGKVE